MRFAFIFTFKDHILDSRMRPRLRPFGSSWKKTGPLLTELHSDERWLILQLGAS